ncbi:MAG: hypothetical protein LV481_08895 [Methylacidiphilales bacterium]|nr:hypothetical protein [Candidatus Methylacidiphilales bacterium]
MSNRNSRHKQSTSNYARFLERFLAVVGALTLLVIAILGITFLYTNIIVNSDPTAERYARESGLAILSVHSEQDMQTVLLQRLSPEAQKTSTPAGIAQMVEALNKLGKFEDYKGVESSHVQTGLLPFSERLGSNITYTASAAFEHGTGLVKMALIHNGDDWQINGFSITTTPNPN